MDWVEPVGVLGGLALGAIGLAWRIRSQRVRLYLEIDDERSGFTTVDVRPNDHGAGEPETRTGISIVLAVSNVSPRANTVVRIEVQAPMPHQPLPDNASFVTDVLTKPDPVYPASFTVEEQTYWDFPEGWRSPHSLPSGERHEAGLTYLLAGDPQPRENELPVEVTVTDTHGKRYQTKAQLKHR